TVVNALRITATPARHFSARRLGDRNRTLWCGFAFELDGTRAFFAGDTAYHQEFGDVGARSALVHARGARGPGRGGADLRGPREAARGQPTAPHARDPLGHLPSHGRA